MQSQTLDLSSLTQTGIFSFIIFTPRHSLSKIPNMYTFSSYPTQPMRMPCTELLSFHAYFKTLGHLFLVYQSLFPPFPTILWRSPITRDARRSEGTIPTPHSKSGFFWYQLTTERMIVGSPCCPFFTLLLSSDKITAFMRLNYTPAA